MTTDNQGVSREECEAILDGYRTRPESLYDIPAGCICQGDGLYGMPCDAKTHAVLKPSVRLARLALLDSSEKDKADAMIAHRWFAARFGEIMNGRDFSVKCAIASRELFDLHQRHEKTIADLREQLAEVTLERDALLGAPEAVHLGAQAAITALRQCQSTAAERDSLRTHLQHTQDVARELLAALKDAAQLLSAAPMSFPYNDRSHEVRKVAYPAIARARVLLDSEGKAESKEPTDTERLDWLNKNCDGADHSGYGADDMWWKLIYNDGNRKEAATIREAIDAAMASTKDSADAGDTGHD